MRKLIAIMILSLSFETVVFAEIREPQKMDRITLETVSVSEPLLTNQIENKKQSWIKKHPVIAGTLIGLGAGFTIGVIGGESFYSDTNRFGNGIVIGGFGAGIGAVVGKVASEY